MLQNLVKRGKRSKAPRCKVNREIQVSGLNAPRADNALLSSGESWVESGDYVGCRLFHSTSTVFRANGQRSFNTSPFTCRNHKPSSADYFRGDINVDAQFSLKLSRSEIFGSVGVLELNCLVLSQAISARAREYSYTFCGESSGYCYH